MGGEGPELCKSTEGVAWGRRQGQADTLPRAIEEDAGCCLLGAWWLRCGGCGACGGFSGCQGSGQWGGLEGGGAPVGGANSLKLGEAPCPLCSSLVSPRQLASHREETPSFPAGPQGLLPLHQSPPCDRRAACILNRIASQGLMPTLSSHLGRAPPDPQGETKT